MILSSLTIGWLVFMLLLIVVATANGWTLS